MYCTRADLVAYGLTITTDTGTAATCTGTASTPFVFTTANRTLALKVDDYPITATIATGSTAVADLATALNLVFTGLTFSNSSNKLKILHKQAGWYRKFEILSTSTCLTLLGLTAGIYRGTNGTAEDAIAQAGSFLEEYTHCYFNPRQKTYLFNGYSISKLFLQVPIISVSEILYDTEAQTLTDFELGNAINPPDQDDRWCPYIKALTSSITTSYMNPWGPPYYDEDDTDTIDKDRTLSVTGIFGFTEEDYLTTPVWVKKATIILASRDLLSSGAATQAVSGYVPPGALSAEHTDIHGVTYNPAYLSTQMSAGSGVNNIAITGDKTIDLILNRFRRSNLRTVSRI